MFESRFTVLIKRWGAEKKFNYLNILQQIINHYFNTVAYPNVDKSVLKITGHYSTTDITYVLEAVGYSNFDIYATGNEVLEIHLLNT